MTDAGVMSAAPTGTDHEVVADISSERERPRPAIELQLRSIRWPVWLPGVVLLALGTSACAQGQWVNGVLMMTAGAVLVTLRLRARMSAALLVPALARWPAPRGRQGSGDGQSKRAEDPRPGCETTPHPGTQDSDPANAAPEAVHAPRGDRVVRKAVVHAAAAGCEWLFVDFGPDLAPFYFDACGFTHTEVGLIHLRSTSTSPTDNG